MKRKMLTVYLVVLIATFFMVGNSFAQQGTGVIYGMVTDQCTGAVLDDVRVANSLFGEDYTTDGFYILLSNAGSGTLFFIKNGYATGVAGFILNSGVTIEINFALYPAGGCVSTTTTQPTTTTSVPSSTTSVPSSTTSVSTTTTAGPTTTTTMPTNEWPAMTIGTDTSLAAIWGSSGSDVFAVGLGSILHYDGSTLLLVKREIV